MNITFLQFFLVGLASALGGMLRYGVARAVPSSNFPLATMLINITGSFFLGWFLTFCELRLAPSLHNDLFRLAIATGFVGAYTTFSTYMFESDKLFQDDGLGLRPLLYLAGSLFLGLLAVRLGIILARRV